MRRLLLCSILVLLASALVLAFAALRTPTTAEKLVLEKYESVISKTLDQFQGDDWDENVDYSVNEDVAVGTNAGRTNSRPNGKNAIRMGYPLALLRR
jgi:hypothetical protein